MTIVTIADEYLWPSSSVRSGSHFEVCFEPIQTVDVTNLSVLAVIDTPVSEYLIPIEICIDNFPLEDEARWYGSSVSAYAFY